MRETGVEVESLDCHEYPLACQKPREHMHTNEVPIAPWVADYDRAMVYTGGAAPEPEVIFYRNADATDTYR